MDGQRSSGCRMTASDHQEKRDPMIGVENIRLVTGQTALATALSWQVAVVMTPRQQELHWFLFGHRKL